MKKRIPPAPQELIKNWSILPVCLTSSEVANLLRCSPRSIIRLYRGYTRPDGTFVRPVLGYTRRGRNILFSKHQLEKYLLARTVQY